MDTIRAIRFDRYDLGDAAGKGSVALVGLTIPDDLAPEVYPLAWLAGTWRGPGTIGYGPIQPGRIVQEVSFQTTDGPYLACQARTWLLPEGDPCRTHDDPPMPTGQAPSALWHQESGFWRVTPGQTQSEPPFEVEVLVSDAAGYQSLYLGQVSGPRVNLATDAVVRTASAPTISAATRMYGLVGGDLLWAWDIAGFGHELGSYMAAQLSRIGP
jgi:hypothetical protein